MKRRLAVVPLLAVALFGLAACNNGSSIGGNGGPTTPASDGNQTGTTGGGSTSTGGGGANTRSLNSCDLLSSSAASQLQLTSQGPISPLPPGSRSSCGWNKSVDTSGNGGYAIEIDVRDNQGLKDINTDGGTLATDNVGSHQGRQLPSNVGGSCLVALGVGSSSRVDIQASGGNDSNAMCQVANKVAQAIEPKLPGGN